MDRLFGTDGIRGRANTDLTVDMALDLARAAGEHTEGPVVIGRDTRRSGPMFTTALHAGFSSVGVDTVDVGVLPVGGVSRLLRQLEAPLAVMVSASHNPAHDNGIKFIGPSGGKLNDEQEAVIETRYRRGAPWKHPDGALIGIRAKMPDAVDRYVENLARNSEYSLRGLEFVLDCANGAAYQAAPKLFESLGASVEVHAAGPDGLNINEGCGATVPEYVARYVNGRVGLAFDGDADRLIAVDEDGVIANGDVLMAVFAKHLKENGELRNNIVVSTVMANLGFRRAMEQLDVDIEETAVGDRYVYERMRDVKAALGGEQSGHIIFYRGTSGDGLRTAVRLAEVMAATGKPLTELRKVITEYPQVLHNIQVADKSKLAASTEIWGAVEDAERTLGDDGRILVRASGTEPLVRVMVEAATEDIAEGLASSVGDVVVNSLS
ncbi:MAG: phosphoglucosamine mutase [bacterium]|nr:phosphoglucosamine mutase [bacterium]MCP4965561.1 phosphoglucosamine mutase [bacterium]